MNVLIASDKFKGSLTSIEVCEAIKAGVLVEYPNAQCQLMPMADGGEGTLEVLKDLLNLEIKTVEVQDPLFRPVEASYGIKGKSAYIEMALASGFELLTDDERSALKTSSIGTGELIRDAIANGAKDIKLFVGGSASNDGGVGLATALGFRFLDEIGNEILPIGENLSQITEIASSELPVDLKVTLITDVKNPLLGPQGASFQYGPQKGATEKDVLLLEKGMEHVSRLIKNKFQVDVDIHPGSGAAGGLGLCVLGLMNGTIQHGIETILNAVDFRKKLSEADLVITGEGKIDQQTLQGKVVYGVLKEARYVNVPVVAICGINTLDSNQLSHLGLTKALSLKTDQLSVDYCIQNAAELIKLRISEFLRSFPSFDG